MKEGDKEFIFIFIIACFVSLLFYYINLGTVSPYSHNYYGVVMYDIYWIYLGIGLPFIYPIYYMYRHNKKGVKQ